MAIQTGLQRYLFLLFCKNIFKFTKVLPIDFQIPELAHNDNNWLTISFVEEVKLNFSENMNQYL